MTIVVVATFLGFAIGFVMLMAAIWRVEELAETILQQQYTSIDKEKQLMSLSTEQTAAIQAAVASALEAILTAITKEKQEVLDAITAASTASGLSAADLADIVAKIEGIGTQGAAAVNSIVTPAAAGGGVGQP